MGEVGGGRLSQSLGVQAQKSHLFQPVKQEFCPPLPIWGEPGHRELRALVVQTHSGKVATKNEGQLVLRCLVWCLACELQSGFSARLPC